MPAKFKPSKRFSRTKFNFSSAIKSNSNPNLKSTSEEKETNGSQNNSSSKNKFNPFHRHACRAHIRQVLNTKRMISEEKSIRQIKNKRIQLHFISEQYRRKMSEGFQVSSQECLQHRKISWGEQSEYIRFDNTQTCESIRLAPRYKFSIDESD